MYIRADFFVSFDSMCDMSECFLWSTETAKSKHVGERTGTPSSMDSAVLKKGVSKSEKKWINMVIVDVLRWWNYFIEIMNVIVTLWMNNARQISLIFVFFSRRQRISIDCYFNPRWSAHQPGNSFTMHILVTLFSESNCSEMAVWKNHPVVPLVDELRAMLFGIEMRQ